MFALSARLTLMLATLTAALTVPVATAGDVFARLRDDEEGATTTELAVITFLLVGAAIVVMGIIFLAATSNANNIPVPELPA